MPLILLVDDEPSQRQALRRVLETRDYKVAEASGVQEAETEYNLTEFDLIVTELKLAGASGAELIRSASPVPVIVMTNYASLRSAVDSMKAGAVDYLAKPCSDDDLLNIVAAALPRLGRADVTSKKHHQSTRQFFQGHCPTLRKLDEQVQKVARTDSTVLIQGETGTGKELTARRVHSLSRRNGRPLVSLNCAAIPESLIESELFGYEKGAFTGATSNRMGLIEAANGGTLFLDEIGELPQSAQARLLRFIQEGEIRQIGAVSSKTVDVRLICATHRDLSALASQNEFRKDLFYRINVLGLTIPPLRQRSVDIASMAQWFAATLAEKLGLQPRALSENAINVVTQHPWPGNVRELEHAVERGLVMAEGAFIEALDMGLTSISAKDHDAPLSIVTAATTEIDTEDPLATDEELSLEDYFMRFVLEHQDSMSETQLAQKLGVSRKCLWERRQRFDIPRSQPSKRGQR